MKNDRKRAFLFLAAFIVPIFAQAQTVDGVRKSQSTYYRYEATIENAFINEGKKADLNLELLVPQDGSIADIQLYAAKGSCQPICWRQGNPPTRMCMFPCTPTGDGPILQTRPILVELLERSDGTAQSSPSFDLVLRELSSANVDNPQTFQLQLKE